MLYTLRYENDEKSRQLRAMLKNDKGMSEQKLSYIDCLLDYAGKSQRKGDLFKDSSLGGNAKRFLNSMFGEDVKNVLLQHKSWLTGTVIEQFSRGRLDLMQFPYFSGDG